MTSTRERRGPRLYSTAAQVRDDVRNIFLLQRHGRNIASLVAIRVGPPIEVVGISNKDWNDLRCIMIQKNRPMLYWALITKPSSGNIMECKPPHHLTAFCEDLKRKLP